MSSKRIPSLDEYINESEEVGIWKQGFQNTKLFSTEGATGAYGTKFLQGCRHCNAIVKLDNMFKERQLVGNCYQSLCNCSKCKRYVVFDEDKYQALEIYLNKINQK